MGWASADAFIEDRFEQREADIEIQRQRGLEEARRRVEVEVGPPPPDEPDPERVKRVRNVDPMGANAAAELAARVKVILQHPDHILDIEETNHLKRGRLMYRANCMCGWRARIPEPTPLMARRHFERHVARES